MCHEGLRKQYPELYRAFHAASRSNEVEAVQTVLVVKWLRTLSLPAGEPDIKVFTNYTNQVGFWGRRGLEPSRLP